MPRPTALRDALRVKPGSRVQLEKLDPGATFGHDKASSVARDRRARWSGCATCRTGSGRRRSTPVLVVLQGIDAAGKDGTIAKVMDAFNPQGCPVTSFKVPTAGGARPRLPVARSTSGRRARARSASSTARTTRTCSSSGSTTSSRASVWSKRYDQINDFERTLADERHDHRQVLPDDRPRRAAPAHPGALRRPDEALEVQARRPRGAQALGRLPGRVRRRADEDVDRRGRRGTSSRPTATGSATWRSRRSWPTRWPA